VSAIKGTLRLSYNSTSFQAIISEIMISGIFYLFTVIVIPGIKFPPPLHNDGRCLIYQSKHKHNQQTNQVFLNYRNTDITLMLLTVKTHLAFSSLQWFQFAKSSKARDFFLIFPITSCCIFYKRSIQQPPCICPRDANLI
jgi:hypothetical protein